MSSVTAEQAARDVTQGKCVCWDAGMCTFHKGEPMLRHLRTALDLLDTERARNAPMPCGHPAACVVSTDEGTAYCGWCAVDGEREAALAEVGRFRTELADARADVLASHGDTTFEVNDVLAVLDRIGAGHDRADQP